MTGSVPCRPANAHDHHPLSWPASGPGRSTKTPQSRSARTPVTNKIAAAAGPEMGRCASHHENTNATIESVTAGSSPGISSPFTSAMGSRRTAPRVSQKTPHPVVGRNRCQSTMNQGDCSDEEDRFSPYTGHTSSSTSTWITRPKPESARASVRCRRILSIGSNGNPRDRTVLGMRCCVNRLRSPRSAVSSPLGGTKVVASSRTRGRRVAARDEWQEGRHPCRILRSGEDDERPSTAQARTR